MEPSTLPRRAELLAALSLAIDLGLGQPMAHLLRSCILGSPELLPAAQWR